MTTESLRPYAPGKWWTPLLVTMVVLPIAAEFAPWPLMSRLLLGGHRAILLSGLAILTIHGFRLRQRTWTSESWRRFAASILVGIGFMALLYTFAMAGDARTAWVIAVRNATGVFGLFILLMCCIFGAAAMTVIPLHRFACDPVNSQYDTWLARLWRRATGAV